MDIQSLRSHKFYGIALFDLVTGMLGMVILFLVMWKIYFKNLEWWKFIIAGILLTIPVGIVFHIIFGVNTRLNYDFGLSGKPI
jgi:NADH:ubiquinone oxidoreductase subunit 3 (subunit A)